MYCLTCGYKIEGTPKFCPECGSRLEGNASETNPAGNSGGQNVGTPSPAQGMPVFPGGMPIGFAGLGMIDSLKPEALAALEKMRRNGWRFEYSTGGMMFRSGVTYRAWKDEDKTYLQVRMSGVDLKDAPVFEADASFAGELEAILNSCNADAWNGFSGHAQNVFDGDNFSFSFQDGNGRHIYANGYMAWPEGFHAGCALWGALFYREYDKHFPNYYKRLQDYIRDTVYKQYGKCDFITYQVNYISNDGETFRYGESSMKEGIITYRGGNYTQPKENDDTDNKWIEALLVRSVKKPLETRPEINKTGIVLEVYRSDEEGIRKVTELPVFEEVSLSDDGEAAVFTREFEGRTMIGIYRKVIRYYGLPYKELYFAAGYFDGAEFIASDQKSIATGANVKCYSEEDAAGIAEVMEKIGLTDTAARFREQREDFRITEPYANLARISWFNNLDNGFPEALKNTEPDQNIAGYRVQILINAMEVNFG